MMDQGTVRNLEQIQEDDGAPRAPRVMSAAIVVLGWACVVFAAMALGGRRSAPPAPPADPLGDLVAHRASPSPSAKALDLSPADVTFPGLLSDGKSPTTALAAVRPSGAIAAAAPAVVIGA